MGEWILPEVKEEIAQWMKAIEEDRQRKVIAERKKEKPNYVILDAALWESNMDKALELSPVHCSLFATKGIDYELGTVPPYLFPLTEGSEFDGWLQKKEKENLRALYLRSELSMEPLRKHLRRFLRIKTEEGKWLFFRFYDPDVAITTFGHLTEEQQTHFFSHITNLRCRDDLSGNDLVFADECTDTDTPRQKSAFAPLVISRKQLGLIEQSATKRKKTQELAENHRKEKADIYRPVAEENTGKKNKSEDTGQLTDRPDTKSIQKIKDEAMARTEVRDKMEEFLTEFAKGFRYDPEKQYASTEELLTERFVTKAMERRSYFLFIKEKPALEAYRQYREARNEYLRILAEAGILPGGCNPLTDNNHKEEDTNSGCRKDIVTLYNKLFRLFSSPQSINGIFFDHTKETDKYFFEEIGKHMNGWESVNRVIVNRKRERHDFFDLKAESKNLTWVLNFKDPKGKDRDWEKEYNEWYDSSEKDKYVFKLIEFASQMEFTGIPLYRTVTSG